MGQAPRGPKICRDLGQTLANIVKAVTPQAFNIKKKYFSFCLPPPPSRHESQLEFIQVTLTEGEGLVQLPFD